MKSLNSQKKTQEALTIASDVLDLLGVEAAWLKSTKKADKDRQRYRIKKLVNKRHITKRLASLPLITNQRKLKVRGHFFCFTHPTLEQLLTFLLRLPTGNQDILLATYCHIWNWTPWVVRRHNPSDYCRVWTVRRINQWCSYLCLRIPPFEEEEWNFQNRLIFVWTPRFTQIQARLLLDLRWVDDVGGLLLLLCDTHGVLSHIL